MKDDLAFAAVIFSILAGCFLVLAIGRFDPAFQDAIGALNSGWPLASAKAATTCTQPATASASDTQTGATEGKPALDPKAANTEASTRSQTR